VTRTYQLLRVCERFGLDPRSIDDWSPGLRTILLDFEAVRGWEEGQEMKVLAGVPR